MKATIAELTSATVEVSLRRFLLHEGGVRLGRDPEDVHQARVAIRQLRANLGALEPFVETLAYRQTVESLRPLGRLLGAVRDADVLAARLRRAAETLEVDDRARLDELVERLHVERDEAHCRLLNHLGQESHALLIDRLYRLSEDPPLIDPSAKAAPLLVPILVRSWGELSKAVRKLGDKPTDRQLHRVRVRVKRCRYVAEMSGVVVGTRARRLGRAITPLQETLGELQDASVAERWLRSAVADASSHQAMVAGQLIGDERRRAELVRSEWRSEWDSVRAKGATDWLGRGSSLR